jgi:general secretion pathway protein G
MELALVCRVMHRPKAERTDHRGGFSLLETMMVTVILIVASIATPIYQTCVVRAREAVLRDHLFTLGASAVTHAQAGVHGRLDSRLRGNDRPVAYPLPLEELVEKGYLGRLPTDPFAGREQGIANSEQAVGKSKQMSLGIEDVHSGSNALSLEGTPYSSW